MSSSMTSIDAMQSAQTYLYQIACPILIVIGTVGCILNLIVFTQKKLRKNPCSIYFIAYNITNFLYIYSSLLALTLDTGYNIDPSSHNLIICHLRLYFSVLFSVLSPFYLILASIDRILVTSPNALTRRRSTQRLASICIISGTLFWVLFHTHALIMTNIVQFGPNYFVCYFQPGIYLSFVGYYSIIEEILVMLFMIICGAWPIKNIRNTRRTRVAPSLSVSGNTLGGGPFSTSSKDRQLVLMLVVDTTMYILFNLALGTFLMYQQITQNDLKLPEQIQIETFARNICLFSVGISVSTSCYTNLTVSKTFRSEAKKALSWQRMFGIH